MSSNQIHSWVRKSTDPLAAKVRNITGYVEFRLQLYETLRTHNCKGRITHFVTFQSNEISHNCVILRSPPDA